MLLGNDLAGNKVVVNPLTTIIPCIYQPPKPIEQEIPDFYPFCAVTRAMAKKAKQNDGDVDLTYTFWVSLLNMRLHSLRLAISRISILFASINYNY